MAERNVVIRIRAELGAFRRDMDAAAAKAKETAKKTEEAGRASQSGIGRLADTANRNREAWDRTASGMVAGGAAIVGALGLSTKAAMDWESAWAGVTKTVDGTDAQMAQLEDGLRGLARTLPSTHAEIAGVAEAAGQLGVAREDVIGFTKTMVDLGVSTNLTAEDAATQIAQISNVMGTMEREGSEGVARFGATLVALGNDGASTEREILAMAQRIAGAAATLGASEADVLALSNTLASMGVRAELGGGVTTRVLLKMRTAVDEGSKTLDKFAQTAGMTSEEFSTLFREAPMEALDSVTQGINRVNESGGNVVRTLKEMGIKGTEELQVILALSNAGTLLSDSLELGAKSWEENNALVEEATKRYETAESKVKIAWNNIKDSAIDAGSVILPAVAGIAEAVAKVAGAFADLPTPVQTAVVTLAGLVGVAALAGGAFMKLVPNLMSTIAGFRELRASTQRAHGPMTQMEARTRRLGSAAKTAATGLLALATVGPIIGSMVSSGDLAELDALTASLMKTGNATQSLDSSFTTGGGFGAWIAGLDVHGLEDAFRVIGNPNFSDKADQTISKILTLGSRGSSNMEFVTKNFEQLDAALSGMVKSGHAEDAADSYEEIAEKAKAAGVPTEKLAEIFPQYAAALELANAESKKTDMAPVAEDLDSVRESAEAAAKRIDDFYEAMVNAGMVVLGEREALRGMQEAFKGAADAVTKNGRTLDITTEKGRANQAALDGIADASFRAMEAQRQNGATTQEMAKTIQAGRDEFIKYAEKMGLSTKEAKKLADQINLIPGAVYVSVDANTDDIGDKIREIYELIKASPDGKVKIEENTPEVRQALKDLGLIVKELPDGTIQVTDDGTSEVTGKKIDKIADKYREARIKATTDGTDEANKRLNWVARDRESEVTVTTSRIETITKKFLPSENPAGPGNGPITKQFGGPRDKQFGGKLPGKKDGGKLPYTGLGTDMILGVSSSGRPVANVDDGEWIIRESSATKYNGVLAAINADDPSVQGLAGYEGGGRPGMSAAQVGVSGTTINLGGFVINGATDANRVVRRIKDDLTVALERVGMRVPLG